VLLAKGGDDLDGVIADGDNAQPLRLDLSEMTLQLDQLRFAVGSPIRGSDEDQHRTLGPHDRTQVPHRPVLIFQVEIRNLLPYLRPELGDLELFLRGSLRRERNLR
jgi:hypothetical protein